MHAPSCSALTCRWLAVWTDAAEAAEETARAAHEPLAATGFSAQHYLRIYFALGGCSLIFQVPAHSSPTAAAARTSCWPQPARYVMPGVSCACCLSGFSIEAPFDCELVS